MYIACKYGQILERKKVDKDFTYFIQMTNLLNNVGNRGRQLLLAAYKRSIACYLPQNILIFLNSNSHTQYCDWLQRQNQLLPNGTKMN